MPAPGCQKPMPNLALAERRNSKTSRFSCSAAGRSDEAPARAWMRWSQCTVVGTATLLRPAWTNCKSAICAVASCIATRSGRSIT